MYDVRFYIIRTVCYNCRTIHCAGSNEIVLARLVYDDSRWPADPILTTPNVCMNEIFCGVMDSNNQSGYDMIIIENIIGKLIFKVCLIIACVGAGLTYGGVPISNNTSIVAENNTFTSTIGCHSGSLDSNNGVWILPDGSELSQSSDVFVVGRNGVVTHSSISLSTREGIELPSTMFGIYKCLIIDMDNIKQILSFQLTMGDSEGTCIAT